MTDQQTLELGQPVKEKSPLEIVCEGLAEVQAGLKQILADPKYNSVLIYLDSSLKGMIARLHFMTGTAPQASPVEEFPPVTNFMGEAITIPKKIVAEDLQPEDLEKERYLEKVNHLYLTIDTIPASGILNTYTLPEDLLVVRGVAKKAGVEGYEERPVDEALINDIVAAINLRKARDQEEQRIEKELKMQKRLSELTPKLEDTRKAGDQIASQLEAAKESLEKATTDNARNKAQQRIDLLKVQLDTNLEQQLKLEEEISLLKLGTDADTGKR